MVVCLPFPFFPFPIFPSYTASSISNLRHSSSELIFPSEYPFRREYRHEHRPEPRRPVELSFDQHGFLVLGVVELGDEVVGRGERHVAAARARCDGGERFLVEIEPLEFEIGPANLDRQEGLRWAGYPVFRAAVWSTISLAKTHPVLLEHLKTLPYPHYAPADAPGLLIRTTADGKRTVGRFVKRNFQPVKRRARMAQPRIALDARDPMSAGPLRGSKQSRRPLHGPG